MNLSLGSSQYSGILEYVIDEAAASGITIVAAAGNGGDEGVEYPAALDNVIAVGSVDNHGEKSDFSAEGEGIDVVAPGEHIQVQSMLGMYTWAGGTSMSAPHVTAEASLILQMDPSKDGSFVKELIKETSNEIEDDNCGSGVIDIDRAQECFDEFDENYVEGDGADLADNPSHLADYSDDDVSYEGRWAIENHFSDLIGNHGDAIYNGHVTTTAMRAIKRGAGYNDLEKISSTSRKKVFTGCWHGHYRLQNSTDYTGFHQLNYISAYRLIRKIGNLGGDVSSLPSTNPYNWITNNSYTNIYSKFANGGIGSKTWAEAIDKKPTGTYSESVEDIVDLIYQNPKIYSGTEAHLKSLRKCFIYGMAVHHVADTFAHSTFVYKQFNSMIVHPGYNSTNVDENPHARSGETTYFPNEYADDITFKPNRFKDAKAAAQRVVLACVGQSVGIAETYQPDFSVNLNNTTGYRGYYLARVWTYAKEVHGGVNSPSDSPAFSTYFSTFHYKAPINE